MELKTIGQVSKHFSISNRTLRYYEQVGLIMPTKKDNYAYRVYDMEAIKRLRQVIILRKLRIPLKQIAEMLNNSDVSIAIDILERNLSDIEEEIASLSTIRDVVEVFINRLNIGSDVFVLPDDEGLLEIVDSLTVSKINFKEDKSLEQLNQASKKLNKLEDNDVRIVYLPPMSVAVTYAYGDDCEGKVFDTISQFVRNNDLLRLKPDARSFGFDCSTEDMAEENPSRAYEMWVSIPDDMEVSLPLVKRTFNGGLYAAHVLRTWDFEDWRLLKEWVSNNDKYEEDCDTKRWNSTDTCVGYGFEETLNFYHYIQHSEMEALQLDLLLPIKEKDKEKLNDE
ncbi:MerR family transcriptional regulator [Anaerosporobacter faecicola]|uniref:MerR family transcriptional regulator n=1 Tax=Anaerosporobacter faecicola TaxID=2718714 RepID=UPI0014391132|nr:MerR family transcriptional regulator [Anaerosporobacter faecicola]